MKGRNHQQCYKSCIITCSSKEKHNEDFKMVLNLQSSLSTNILDKWDHSVFYHYQLLNTQTCTGFIIIISDPQHFFCLKLSSRYPVSITLFFIVFCMSETLIIFLFWKVISWVSKMLSCLACPRYPTGTANTGTQVCHILNPEHFLVHRSASHKQYSQQQLRYLIYKPLSLERWYSISELKLYMK